MTLESYLCEILGRVFVLVTVPQTVHLYTVLPVFWQVAAVVVPLSGLCPVAGRVCVLRTFLQSLHLVTLLPAFTQVGLVTSSTTFVCLHTAAGALVTVTLQV